MTQSRRFVVKICGLRRPAHAELAVELGARYLGCVLASDSPRAATQREVVAVVDAAGAAAEVVLVFRQPSEGEVLDACAATGVRRVQVHGASPMACRALASQGLQVHPVFRMDAGAEQLPVLDPVPAPDCPAILDQGPGGSGQRFDWSLLAGEPPPATLIAGGITPDNVDELLRCQPFGIDVSSGIESRPGEKDASRMQELFAAVRAAGEMA